VGRPIRSQLAERLPNPEAVIKRLGMVAVQPKYDGIRVQIHKNGSAVRVFSRNLEDFTLMFSELTTAARGLKDETLILDGEAIAYSKESEEYLPFQLTASRRRQHGIEQAARDLPLVAFIFDILYRNGRDLTELPYEQRLAMVDEAENDRFGTITKLGTGLSDAEWRQIHERADKLQVDQRPARVDSILVPDVWLEPEVVVEVMADEITPSPRHTAGKVGDQPGF